MKIPVSLADVDTKRYQKLYDNLWWCCIMLQRKRLDFTNLYRKYRDEIQQTPEYGFFRKQVIGRAQGICERCGQNKGTEVHHILRIWQAPERIIDPTNALLVCDSCHRNEHDGVPVWVEHDLDAPD